MVATTEAFGLEPLLHVYVGERLDKYVTHPIHGFAPFHALLLLHLCLLNKVIIKLDVLNHCVGLLVSCSGKATSVFHKSHGKFLLLIL